MSIHAPGPLLVVRWTVDLAVGDGEAAFGVETRVHDDGVEAHVERHLALRRAGWFLTEAFERSRQLRPEEIVVELATLAASRAAAV